MRTRTKTIVALFFLASCSPPDEEERLAPEDDLGLGNTEDNTKEDGWGHALICKEPTAEQMKKWRPLTDPKITISLDGLTLHLVGESYDKVFPVGVGEIDHDKGSLTYGQSLSTFPVLERNDKDARSATFHMDTGSREQFMACRTWWTDRKTGAQAPVFAGLPFMRWSGSYAIHGPVDNYRAPNGGSLRRGFVSHGCIRMEAQDVLEVYHRIKGTGEVPVEVMLGPERSADGKRIDVPRRWIGAECVVDGDCDSYEGGYCHPNEATPGRGFCSKACAASCPDRAGDPTTFCVADPTDVGNGICVVKESKVNEGCRPYAKMAPRDKPRFNQAGVTARVCFPQPR